jgi:hypothetical protein
MPQVFPGRCTYGRKGEGCDFDHTMDSLRHYNGTKGNGQKIPGWACQ